MSYDVDLYRREKPACPTCGHKEESGGVFTVDPTYNIGGIVRYALHEWRRATRAR